MLFGRSTSNALSPAVDSTLTIGSGITVRGSNGSIGDTYSEGSAVVNQGTIAADDSGGQIGTFAYDAGYSGNWSYPGFIYSDVDTSRVIDPAPRRSTRPTAPARTSTTPSRGSRRGRSTRCGCTSPMTAMSDRREDFDVSVNGALVLADFDIIAAAGGQNNAVVESLAATASPQGQVTINFKSQKGYCTGQRHRGGRRRRGRAGDQLRIGRRHADGQPDGTFTNQGILEASNGDRRWPWEGTGRMPPAEPSPPPPPRSTWAIPTRNSRGPTRGRSSWPAAR